MGKSCLETTEARERRLEQGGDGRTLRARDDRKILRRRKVYNDHFAYLPLLDKVLQPLDLRLQLRLAALQPFNLPNGYPSAREQGDRILTCSSAVIFALCVSEMSFSSVRIIFLCCNASSVASFNLQPSPSVRPSSRSPQIPPGPRLRQSFLQLHVVLHEVLDLCRCVRQILRRISQLVLQLCQPVHNSAITLPPSSPSSSPRASLLQLSAFLLPGWELRGRDPYRHSFLCCLEGRRLIRGAF